MRNHLSDADKKRIHAAVTSAEARTTIHIAAVVVPASDRYVFYPVVWGAAAALVTGGIVAAAFPHTSLRLGFAIEVLAFVALSLVFDWLPLRLRLVPRHIRHAHARALAHREFAARILGSSERQGGVLLFVSLGEQYAEVIADRHVHARVGAEAWNRIVAEFVSAARSGRVAEGAVAAIESCARLAAA